MNKCCFTLTLLITTLQGFAQAPNWNWAKVRDSVNFLVTATDNAGNVYAAGGWQNYLEKYDAAGNLLWSKLSSSSNTTASDIFVDDLGNIFLSGGFSATAFSPMYFDTIALVSLNNSSDLFTAKLDPAGNVQWAKSAGGPSDDFWTSGISTDQIGNVYVTGGVDPSVPFIFGNDTFQTTGTIRGFSFFKYDVNGNEQWCKFPTLSGVSGNITPASTGISTDNNGNSYIIGIFSTSSIDFGGVSLTNSTTGYPDYFLVKYDASGNALWAKGTDNVFGIWGRGISMDTAGYIYVTGSMDGDTEFDSILLTWPGRCFIVKYDTSGNALWAKNFGDHYGDRSHAISTDNNGNSYVAGSFYDNTFSFGGFTVDNMDPTENTFDIFIVKFDSTGNEKWVKSAGSDTSETVSAIHVDANANVYIVGQFNALQFYFDNIMISDTATCFCTGQFIARLDHCSAYYTLYADTIPNNWIAVNHASGIAPISYQWDWGDGTFSSGAAPTHVYSTPGFYNICLTIIDAQGCANSYCDSSIYINRGNVGNAIISINVILPNATGIDDINDPGLDISVYPNPSNGNLNISIPFIENGEVEIYNLQGKKLYSEKLDNASTNEITLYDLQSGMYIIKLTSDDLCRYKKIIIDHLK